MSNDMYPIDVEGVGPGWWRAVVGSGPQYGIDISRFHVVVPAPIGAPFGSTSPITHMMHGDSSSPIFGSNFPRITPADMADAHAALLDFLGIDRVHAVVGGSMGGMQALQFALRHSSRTGMCAAIATTGHTSPSTVALRSVQRAAIQLDPVLGMGIARKIGTICYRSRDEFDARFDWDFNTETSSFEIERYLDHQAHRFVEQVRYDVGCYVALSEAMDLMDLSFGFDSLDEALARWPVEQGRDIMLLPYSTDLLMPPAESERLANQWKCNGVNVHFEVLETQLGHDAFLVEHQVRDRCDDERVEDMRGWHGQCVWCVLNAWQNTVWYCTNFADVCRDHTH